MTGKLNGVNCGEAESDFSRMIKLDNGEFAPDFATDGWRAPNTYFSHVEKYKIGGKKSRYC